MQILDKPINRDMLRKMAEKMFGNLIKAVVDVEREVVAIDAELHVDLAEFLFEKGSVNKNLWGVNIYPDGLEEKWLEFDSVLNLKPNFGNRSRNVEDAAIREKIKAILKNYIKL